MKTIKLRRIVSLAAALVCGVLLTWSAAATSARWAANGSHGDVNSDGVVDIEDMNICINIVLGFITDAEVKALADLTGDGTVDISDVNAVINVILNGPSEPVVTTFTVKGVTFAMVKVDGGTFTMGAPVVADGEQDDAKSDERPTHQVTLSSYNIGVTEVTQELWQAVMGSNPSNFNADNGYGVNLQRPVEQVSWSECQSFITKLNRLCPPRPSGNSPPVVASRARATNMPAATIQARCRGIRITAARRRMPWPRRPQTSWACMT